MELSKNYMPAQTESKWYEHWMQKKYFKSVPDKREPFTIVIPPPNVTGVLHMGHTLNETVQDILIRRARMSGYNACWAPGADHASIATEAKVVNMLRVEKGISKYDLSREEFLHHAFEWKEKYGDIIYQQIKKLGCSCDWDRVTFTMDDHYYKAVIKTFVKLYKDGLIYRGARMIHWDPQAKTALSDEEVEYKEVQSKLYYVRYQLAVGSGQFAVGSSQLAVGSGQFSVGSGQFSVGSGQLAMDNAETQNSKPETNNQQQSTNNNQPTTINYITIATTRPETILGDTAICVNPDDERYQHLVGQFAFVPLINRKIPIIADEYVDKNFGTGCLKITPAHDINDYNIGLKYNLPVIDVLNDDGTMSEAAQLFIGEDRFLARQKIVQELREKGNLVKEENIINKNGFSQRTNVVVEPRISTQWFVKMKDLAKPALDAVLNGSIKIYPQDRFLNTYKYWMENVKDWCISRQLWWGQRIPAWYDEQGNIYVAETYEEAVQSWQLAVGNLQTQNSKPETRNSKPETQNLPPTTYNLQLTQDEDVLDTWFSSWLWPMETFHGITNSGNEDIKYYYPTSVLVTGQDIIFFWVARMIMAGLEFKNEIPFHDVYFTGMVRDTQGRKMSKSLGNSPDLLQLIDQFGADALRFGIMIASPAGNDLLFDENSCTQGKNFCNKIWNALKLVKMWEGKLAMDNGQWTMDNGQSETQNSKPETHHSRFTTHDFAIQWFDNRLNEAASEVENLFKEFRLSEALKTIYSLIWDDFCSWYLEWIKPEKDQSIDLAVYEKTIYFFEKLLQLLHPFMPFVTEEIYHLLKARQEGDDLIIKQYEATKPADVAILQQGILAKEIITAARDIKNKYQLKQKDNIDLYIKTDQQELYEKIIPVLIKQLNADKIEFNKAAAASITFMVGKDIFYLLPESASAKGSMEIQRKSLAEEIAYLEGFWESVNKKLNNEKFMKNAKKEIVDIELKKKSDTEEKINALKKTLQGN